MPLSCLQAQVNVFSIEHLRHIDNNLQTLHRSKSPKAWRASERYFIFMCCKYLSPSLTCEKLTCFFKNSIGPYSRSPSTTYSLVFTLYWIRSKLSSLHSRIRFAIAEFRLLEDIWWFQLFTDVLVLTNQNLFLVAGSGFSLARTFSSFLSWYLSSCRFNRLI